MPKTLIAPLGAFLAIFLSLVGSPRAEDDAMDAMRSNCGGDYLRFCAGMSPGGPDVKACFKRNRPNLSAECSTAIAAYEQSRPARSAGQERD